MKNRNLSDDQFPEPWESFGLAVTPTGGQRSEQAYKRGELPSFAVMDADVGGPYCGPECARKQALDAGMRPHEGAEKFHPEQFEMGSDAEFFKGSETFRYQDITQDPLFAQNAQTVVSNKPIHPDDVELNRGRRCVGCGRTI